MAYLISFSFIFIVIGIAAFIKDKELSRKFIHILVGNWVFLLPLFDSYLHALIVPFGIILSFHGLNNIKTIWERIYNDK